MSLEELPQGQGQSKGSVGIGELAFSTHFPGACRRREGQSSGGGQGCRAGLNSMREEGKLQFLNLDGPMPFSNSFLYQSLSHSFLS